MTKDFAKLFRADDLGQILARIAEDEDGDTGVILTIEREGFWVEATLAVRNQDRETAQRVLDRMTAESASEILRQIVSHTDGIRP